MVWISSNSFPSTVLKQVTISDELPHPTDFKRVFQAGLAIVSINPVLFWIASDGDPDIRNWYKLDTGV